jgi:hypothetical protein
MHILRVPQLMEKKMGWWYGRVTLAKTYIGHIFKQINEKIVCLDNMVLLSFLSILSFPFLQFDHVN